MPEPLSDMSGNQEVGYFMDSHFFNSEQLLDINLRNLENLSLMHSLGSVSELTGPDISDDQAYFHDLEPVLGSYIDDPKEGNVSRTVRVPSSEHVAEIVGRQGCKIKDLRARTNTYIKTPMRTQSPVFVVTGKEEAVRLVIDDIQNAAEHFTHIRACRNSKVAGGLDLNRPLGRVGDVMIQVTVPYRVVGLVVGLKGQTIKAIQHETETFIVTPNRDKAPIFEIRGQLENVERARTLILRHIDSRTRQGRAQDSPQNIWHEETRSNSQCLPHFHSEALPHNSHSIICSSSAYSSFSNSSAHSSYSNDSILSASEFSPHCLDHISAWTSVSPPTHDIYLTNLLDHLSGHNVHLSTWNTAALDYTKGPELALSTIETGLSTNNKIPQYSMSVGSVSSSTNSSVSVSPQEFPEGALFSPFGVVKSSSPLTGVHDQFEPSTSTTFHLFSDPPKQSRKLLLGNLFPFQNVVSSHLGESVVGSHDDVITGACGSPGDIREQLEGFEGSTRGSSLASVPGTFVGDSSLSREHKNDVPGTDSSAASSTFSQSELSGSDVCCSPRLFKVCEEADVVAALVPCGHNHFCMECAEGIINRTAESQRKCPVCKDTAADVLRIRGSKENSYLRNISGLVG